MHFIQSLRENARWYMLGTVAVTTLFIWTVVFHEFRDDTLTVAFLDVGQGDAVFIEAPNGNQVLIDGGPGKSVLRQLSRVMPSYDRTIDVVIATHPDQDHIGGLPDVLKRYDIDMYIDPGVTRETGAYQEIVEYLKEKNIKHVNARRGMRLVLDDSVHIDVLFPDRNVDDVAVNLASVITQLVYGETEFLFTGDAPKSIEKYLVQLDGANLESDVLKVGHHGSKTSSAEQFIGLTSPQFAVIFAGKDNRYKHPHTEVLGTFNNFDIPLLRTDLLGTIIMSSDGKSVVLE